MSSTGPVRRPRRCRPLEVQLLYRSRDARRAMDSAWQDFTGHCDTESQRRLVTFYETEQAWRTIQVARRCASSLAMRRSRHLLSLLELRHGTDSYSLRDYSEVVHELATGESTTVTTIHVSPLEDYVPIVRPPDEVSLDDVGANAPPVGVCLNSITRRSPT